MYLTINYISQSPGDRPINLTFTRPQGARDEYPGFVRSYLVGFVQVVTFVGISGFVGTGANRVVVGLAVVRSCPNIPVTVGCWLHFSPIAIRKLKKAHLNVNDILIAVITVLGVVSGVDGGRSGGGEKKRRRRATTPFRAIWCFGEG